MGKPASIPFLERAPEGETCYGCGKKRSPFYSYVDANGEHTYHPELAVGRVFTRWRGYGHFCTQTCATRYANWVAENKGTRLVDKSREEDAVTTD